MLIVVINMLHQEGRETSRQTTAEIMLICHCERVNDHRIREAAQKGARTVGQVGRMCGAGTGCGGCVRAIAEIVEAVETWTGIGPSRREPTPRRPLPIAAE